MNILLLENVSFIGGGQRIALNIANALKSEHHITFSLPNFGPMSVELDKQNIPYSITGISFKGKSINLFNTINYTLRSITALFKIAKTIRGEKIDLIYINSARSLLQGVTLCWFYRKKAIFHVHLIYQNKVLLNVIRFLSGARCIKKIVCVSKAVQAQFGKLQHKTLVIYNSIDHEQYQSVPSVRESTRKLLKVESDEILIGSFAAIKHAKGQHILLEALKLLADKQIRNIKCLISGNTEEADYLQSLRDYVDQHNLTEKVTFLDYRQDLKPYYQALDILTINSIESFSLVLLEAVCFGVPVIAASGSGPEEIIQTLGMGTLYELNNAEELSVKLKEVINEKNIGSPDYDRILKTINKNYSQNIFINNIRNLISNW
ncbi:MAG: glycosyltransferase [Candidatus Margulisiibacteriota bacterium]